jgi:hypothetical protein
MGSVFLVRLGISNTSGNQARVPSNSTTVNLESQSIIIRPPRLKPNCTGVERSRYGYHLHMAGRSFENSETSPWVKMLRTRRNKLEFAGKRYSSSSIHDVIEGIRSESRQRYACGNGGGQGVECKHQRTGR